MSTARAAALLVLSALLAGEGLAQNYKRTGSRRPYTHRIELFDARERKIDPADPAAPPYSPAQTCKKCHDVAAIARGYHFNAATAGPGARAGEPWILSDARTATELPLSYRGWAGTFRPEQVGLDPLRFVQTFGRQLPGGAASAAGADTSTGRWRLSGDLEIDCMICHAAGGAYSPAVWAKEIAAQNFAWASSAALGLAEVAGSVKSLPDDLDPSTAEGAARLPRTHYAPQLFDAEGKVFFDIVRRPPNAACYACHTTRLVGPGADPRWSCDEDVHLSAGLLCVDCHRNGIEHHTVRGFEGERHPGGVTIATLTCRGCHLDRTDGHGRLLAPGGRLGAPRPLHRGLPLVHLEKLACTSCHSGPPPAAEIPALQSAMAHALGLPSQTRTDADPPFIAGPVQRKDADGVIRPYRVTWPTYWGWLKGDSIVPMAPASAYRTLRRALRVRKDLRAELGRKAASTEAWRAAIVKALAAFAKARPGELPVLVTAGAAHRLDAGAERLVSFEHAAAQPCFWPLAHDVRPARQASGAGGCTDCHAAGAPFLYATVTPRGLLPGAAPIPMHTFLGQEEPLRSFWELAFKGRSAFKWIGFTAAACIALVLLLHLLLGLDGLGRLLRSRGAREPRNKV